MSRGLGWFIAIVGAAIVAFVGVVIWYGTDFLFFASDASRRDEPVTLVYVERAVPGELQPTRSSDGGRQLVNLVESSGGTVLWRGRTDRVEVGSILEEWSVVLIFSLRRGADVVDLFTSPLYRDYDDGAGRRMRGVWAMDELEDFERSTYTLHVIEAKGDRALDYLRRFSRDAAAFGADTIATVELAPVIRQGAPNWTALGIHHFGSSALREGFLRDPRTLTELAINAREIDQEAVVVIEREDG